jgi:WD40 repeat protein
VTVTVDGRRVVSGSYDKTLRIWDLESGACLAIARLNAICRVVAVARGDRIVVGTSTGEILQFNLCGMSLTAVSQAS